MRLHLGVGAQPHEGGAGQPRRPGPDGHAAQAVRDDGALQGYGALADVVVLDLGEGGVSRFAPPGREEGSRGKGVSIYAGPST